MSVLCIRKKEEEKPQKGEAQDVEDMWLVSRLFYRSFRVLMSSSIFPCMAGEGPT